ncbi:MAG: CBS domain-containing protein [Nitrosotalea sp.]
MNSSVKGSKDSLFTHSLEKLLPNSLLSTPAVGIRNVDTLGEAVSLLPHYLETLTDSLVVTSHEKPVGFIGGLEVLDNILKNPTSRMLEETTVGQVMNKNLVIISPQTKLFELVEKWTETRRAFAIIPNQYHGFSVISARKLLEVGRLCKIKISNIPRRRKTVTFHKDQTVREIMNMMFENKTRKLVLEGTSEFISGRIIIEKIARDLNYLRNVDNFLEMKGTIFQLDKAMVVSAEIEMDVACKMMLDMQAPYLIAGNQVVSPWDIVMALPSCTT